jgi:hypothetical protein
MFMSNGIRTKDRAYQSLRYCRGLREVDDISDLSGPTPSLGFVSLPPLSHFASIRVGAVEMPSNFLSPESARY